MQDFDIQEKNKMIYEFMGGRVINEKEIEMPHGSNKVITIQEWSLADGISDFNKDYASTGFFQYHKSYDWLMPVVVKCLELQGDFRWINTFDNALISCDIKQLYDAVIKYITYYNHIIELEKQLNKTKR